jgi:hypothetical protein
MQCETIASSKIKVEVVQVQEQKDVYDEIARQYGRRLGLLSFSFQSSLSLSLFRVL